MVNKSPTKFSVLFLLFALVVFSMACGRNVADIIKEQSDAYLGNNNSDRDRPIMPTATFTVKPPAPPVENPAPPPAQAQPAAPSITPAGQQPQPAAPSATPPGQQPQPASASPATVVGGWYGPYCDEAEGTYYYRWSVDLMQNPADGSYAGTVKFHNCPGGGRVAYRVTGPSQPGMLITLNGVLKDGGGDLYKNAAAALYFTFNLSSGQINPNLSP